MRALALAAYRWVILGACFSFRKRLKRRCGPLQTLRLQKFSRRFFYVYVDKMGVLGTSRENVDNDSMMAIQTMKSRGLDTHEETVHSDVAIALGIHIDLRKVSVGRCTVEHFLGRPGRCF